MDIRKRMYSQLCSAEEKLREIGEEVVRISKDNPDDFLVAWSELEFYLVRQHLNLVIQMFEVVAFGEEDAEEEEDEQELSAL